MRERPPPQLIAMLERLGLATAGQVRPMAGRVHRLARDLPRFESVWVDALAQARILTPFQAAEINAGRGESLGVGPFVLCASLRWPDYAASYRARRLDSHEVVRLAVIEDAGKRAEEILSRLETLAAVSRQLQSEHLVPFSEVGRDGDRVWAASPWIEGRTAAEWMVHNGRFPPEVVLEVAREMLAGLGELEEAGLCHGDVSTSGLMLTDAGGVVLLQPGIRAILRPEEGYANADLRPEAYDYLAPERITDGTPPTTASDVYACGCVWWHLLCGRPPLSGGSSLAKLRAAQAAEVSDVRWLAPEVPGPLAAALSACAEREPGRRPESISRLAAMLGSPTRCGKMALVRCLARCGRPSARWAWSVRAIRQSSRAALWLAAVAGCLVAAAAIIWPVWRAWLPIPGFRRGDQECSIEGPSPNGPDHSPARNSPARNSPAREGGVPLATEALAQPGPYGQGYLETSSDNRVIPAHYQPDRPPPETAATTAEDLVLASGGPLEVQSLQLRAGQCVRGMPGERPLVMVPRTGLLVGADDVRFENIDFVWNHPTEAQDAASRPGAVIDLRAGRAEFRGCSFQSTQTLSTPPAAIRWTHPAERSDSALALPSGRVRLRDCVLRRVGTGADCRTVGALALELANTLHLGSGPLLRLDHCPKADEPVLIALKQVTLRGAGAVLECGYGRIEDQPGEISIQSAGCAFVPAPATALILLSGPESPERLLRNIRWTGQGSLVSPQATIAAWRGADGGEEVLDDAAVSIAGLVRSEVGFAGEARSGPTASRIIRWQVPLRSTDPPGIDPAALPASDATREGAKG